MSISIEVTGLMCVAKEAVGCRGLGDSEASMVAGPSKVGGEVLRF